MTESEEPVNMSLETNQEQSDIGAQDVVRKKLATHRCSIHPSIDLSIFCRQCNKLICPVCLTQEHQQHMMCDIQTIHHEKLGILANKDYVTTNEFMPFFTEENFKLDKILVTHQEHCERMKLKIEEQDRKLKEEITKQTNALLQTFENSLQSAKEEVINRKSKLDDRLFILKKNHEIIDEIKKSNDIRKICKTADDMFDYVSNVNISSAPLPRNNKEYKEGNINTGIISSLIGSLQAITLSDTAEVHLKVLKSYVTDLNAIGKVISGEKTWIKTSTSSVLRKIDLNDELRPLWEKKIKLRDMAINSFGDLFLAIENNPQLKIFRNGENEINDFYKFPKPSFFGKPQVPVALHWYKDNQIFAGTIEKEANTETLTDNVQRQLVRLSEDQQQLKVYEYDQDGKRLFNIPFRITSHSNGDIVFLDKLSNQSGRIVSMTTEGAIKWAYNPLKDTRSGPRFDPWDIVVTSHDNVIICDMINNALHILNCDGQIMICQKTDSLGIRYPASMGIDKHCHLILGCGTVSEEKAKLLILEFKGC
ncbi:unnamed protein product [Mytilus coruscus]|uniref:B box-type domain-containing protein n=1 Tax=Mytilus coruscus TaxID=42192 RepID=A0A6J8DAD0_MYTCO|nr:unnamed protein product [Mytilus coruscus]